MSAQATHASRFFLFLLAAVVVLSGCSGGGSGGAGATLPTAPGPVDDGGADSGSGGGGSGGDSGPGGGDDGTADGGRGTLRLLLTDAPIDEILELWVYIAEVKVKPSGSPVERFPSTLGLVDLLTLQNGVSELLGQDVVAAGSYQFIELLLDESQSYVVPIDTGVPEDLKIPSEKIKIKGAAFDVLADGSTVVTIDFDAEKSLKQTGNGRYQLKPFVEIVAVSQS